MTWVIENPTGDDKAVRAAGGLVVVPAGDVIEVREDWSRAEVARYEAAGLVASKPAAKKPPKAPKPTAGEAEE